MVCVVLWWRNKMWVWQRWWRGLVDLWNSSGDSGGGEWRREWWSCGDDHVMRMKQVGGVMVGTTQQRHSGGGWWCRWTMVKERRALVWWLKVVDMAVGWKCLGWSGDEMMLWRCWSWSENSGDGCSDGGGYWWWGSWTAAAEWWWWTATGMVLVSYWWRCRRTGSRWWWWCFAVNVLFDGRLMKWLDFVVFEMGMGQWPMFKNFKCLNIIRAHRRKKHGLWIIRNET